MMSVWGKRWWPCVVLLGLLITACSQSSPPANRIPYPTEPMPSEDLPKDLRTFPQSAARYISPQTTVLSQDRQAVLSRRYLENFFSPWKSNFRVVPRHELQTRYRNLTKSRGLGENLRPLGSRFLVWVADNAAVETFPSRSTCALTYRTVNLRTLPTIRPLFKAASGPDGFPFDLLQESLLWPGTPIRILHTSRDGQWVFVGSGFVFGWVEACDVAPISSREMSIFMKEQKGAVTADHQLFHAADGTVVGEGRVGMLLPVRGGKTLFPVRRDSGVVLTEVRERIASFPVPMNGANVASIIDSLQGQPYGWGGLYRNRDCSALMRDYFTPFGIWLPRNSYAQARTGRVEKLAGLGLASKKTRLLERGVPFLHLVGRKGHIALYAGRHGGEPVFFHAMWGVPIRFTGEARSNRQIVGAAVFTGAEPGVEHPRRVGRLLLERMDFMTDPSRQD